MDAALGALLALGGCGRLPAPLGSASGRPGYLNSFLKVNAESSIAYSRRIFSPNTLSFSFRLSQMIQLYSTIILTVLNSFLKVNAE